ncbi:hypothetical protein ABZT06_48455 [Streptomyces sp. NPDC005483]|uniref:hypothetical protein n=1 Tax=Streptomyces sp. NPDC005483 TaxID=3154882 RepID=UPI0033B51C84
MGDVNAEAGALVEPTTPARPHGRGRAARAATGLMLALPGSAYPYQGEELGLAEDPALPDSARQDPA